MRLLRHFAALLLLSLLAACASPPPHFRDDAFVMLQRLNGEGGDLLPEAFRSTLDAFRKGESLLQEGDEEQAQRYFYLALLKGALLEQEIREEKARQKLAAQQVEERRVAQVERLAQEEAKRLAQAEAQALAQKEAAEESARKNSRIKPQKEYVLVASHTVKRGESLPLIASQPEVYGDRNLWPLIYRANRDQISDPRHIWPGQVLRVPRNLGRDDISEARRYSQDRLLR